MMKIISLEQMKNVLPELDLMGAIEAGFVAYSQGRSVVPPVGELLFDDPPGEVHIKYGYTRGDESYVIKIASGFFDNNKIGLPSNNGLMLLFDQKTGRPQALLQDEGVLTDVRTAIAGAIAAKYLAPSKVTKIGIVGTGIQARMQLEYLKGVTTCRQVLVWGRGDAQLDAYRADMSAAGFQVDTTQDADRVAAECNLIVTTTPATAPLLHLDALQQNRGGVHITAMGSDTPHKQEVDASILEAADLVVADSISQCRSRGEISKALAAGAIKEDGVVELGQIIAGDLPGRENDDQLTVADLTGVAVQDMAIAQAVFQAITSGQ